MYFDTTFTNGVIKSREKYLLGDKIERMADGNLQDAFRTLKESGFGGDTATESFADSEALIRAEEQFVNAFITEYAPNAYTKAFLLAEYDFHNAEALIKCKFAGASEQKMLGEEGLFTIERLKEAVYSDKLEGLPKQLVEAINQTSSDFEEGKANGFTVDCAFKFALFEYLKTQAKNKKLKLILQNKADSANVSSALRSRDWALCEQMFVEGGKLPKSHIKALCELPIEQIKSGDFSEDIKAVAEVALKGEPLSQFEKQSDNYAVELLNLTRYDMKGIEPFVLYVLRRRAEIRNVRIVCVSLGAGLTSAQIKNKIRLY